MALERFPPFHWVGNIFGRKHPGGKHLGLGNILGGNLPGWKPPGGILPGWKLPGGKLPGRKLSGGKLSGGKHPGGKPEWKYFSWVYLVVYSYIKYMLYFFTLFTLFTFRVCNYIYTVNDQISARGAYLISWRFRGALIRQGCLFKRGRLLKLMLKHKKKNIFS